MMEILYNVGAHFFPTLHSVMLYWYLEVGHGGSIYTIEISKRYKSGLCLMFC